MYSCISDKVGKAKLLCFKVSGVQEMGVSAQHLAWVGAGQDP